MVVSSDTPIGTWVKISYPETPNQEWRDYVGIIVKIRTNIHENVLSWPVWVEFVNELNGVWLDTFKYRELVVITPTEREVALWIENKIQR